MQHFDESRKIFRLRRNARRTVDVEKKVPPLLRHTAVIGKTSGPCPAWPITHSSAMNFCARFLN
jgi:hypothetical protein